MTCRCASPAIHAQRAAEEERYSARAIETSKDKEIALLKAEIAATTADPTKYTILEAYDRANGYLVVKVQFPSCTKCAFEGTKILVYRNVLPIDAMKWKKLDPHFHGRKVDIHSAPSPISRFPGTPEGWSDALAYVEMKARSKH